MKNVYTTTELAEALIYQALLREHGIESIIENERSAFLVVDMLTCAVPFVISVSDDQGQPALDIIEAARSHRLEEDAPTPEANALDPDEFEERVKNARQVQHRQWWGIFVLFFLMPALLVTLHAFISGYWDFAALAGVLFLSVPVFAWILTHRHRQKPPA